jgi:hypothetical protein
MQLGLIGVNVKLFLIVRRSNDKSMEEECNEDIRAERCKNRCNSMGSDERQYRSISYNDKMLKTFLSKESKFSLLSWDLVSNYFLL